MRALINQNPYACASSWTSGCQVSMLSRIQNKTLILCDMSSIRNSTDLVPFTNFSMWQSPVFPRFFFSYSMSWSTNRAWSEIPEEQTWVEI